MSAQRPLPMPSAWSAPYWQAATEKRFVIQGCRSCNHRIMYPKRFCPTCLSEDLDWRDSQGKGEIYSITVQRLGPPTGFSDRVPYVIVIVRLDEGVQLMSNLVGPGAETARCGDRVKVDFEEIPGTNVTLPVFRLDQDQAPTNRTPSP